MSARRHEISTVEMTGYTVTRECACGWVTIGWVPEPDHHTPLTEREAKHLAVAAKIDDQTIWSEIPPRHEYELHLRRRLRTGEPNDVVVTAIWWGGSQEVIVWPWDAQGLAHAQRWCNEHTVRWHHSGFPVGRDDLTKHADITA